MAQTISTELIITISFARLVANLLILKSPLSIKVKPLLLVFVWRLTILTDEISAGKNTMVNNRPNKTPLLAKRPRSATGDTPEKEKDHRPAAVVSDVMAIAKPECPIA